MSELKLNYTKKRVEKFADINYLAQDWLLMHAELERLNELRRWKSCVSEKPENDGIYFIRYYAPSVGRILRGELGFKNGKWNRAYMESTCEWLEIPE